MPPLSVILDGVVGAVAIAFSVLLTPFIRPWRFRWGASDAEVAQVLPGDEIIPNPRAGWTHVVAVAARTIDEWPWIVQTGCRRACWYSYDLLDDGGKRSADRVFPKYQALRVGDVIPFVPKGNFDVPVAAIDPWHALVLGGKLPTSFTFRPNCGRWFRPRSQVRFSHVDDELSPPFRA